MRLAINEPLSDLCHETVKSNCFCLYENEHNVDHFYAWMVILFTTCSWRNAFNQIILLNFDKMLSKIILHYICLCQLTTTSKVLYAVCLQSVFSLWEKSFSFSNTIWTVIWHQIFFGLVWFLFYGPSTHFRSFWARSVNLATLFLGKPLR